MTLRDVGKAARVDEKPFPAAADSSLPEGFAEWAADLPEGAHGWLDAPFGDGVPNAHRFALGAPAAPGFAHPQGLAPGEAAHRFELEVRSAVNVRAELSPDMSTWTAVEDIPGATLQLVPTRPGFQRIVVTPPPGWPTALFRIRVP